jgi:large subunit ribosomal protein L23
MPRVVSNVLDTLKSGSRSLATAVSPSKHLELLQKAKKFQVTTRHSEKLLKLNQASIDKGEPHFRVGGNKQYFPTARVILLRPNAKHTPYQAKFIVPKAFNRLDLRDYLYHVYGLRAFNITTQLLHAPYTRMGNAVARYRTGQIKKMTIDITEPFVWPEEPVNKDAWNVSFFKELEKYSEEKQAFGSDRLKAGTAFGGVLGPYKHKPEPFIPKSLKSQFLNEKNKERMRSDRADDVELVTRHLGLK